MQDIDIFLSDKYVEFSQKIAEIHNKKKAMKDEFKSKFEAFNKELKAMDDEARKVVADFEAWKASAKTDDKKETK